jgi:hypothetical protein
MYYRRAITLYREVLTMAYPVTFDITKPSRFTRPNVFIRILGAIIFSVVNWLVVVLLPLYAAFQISSQKEKYLENETVKGWLRSYIGMASYVYLLTDAFDGTKDPSFRYEITPGGTPSLGSALLRYIMGIPHILIIGALGSVAGIIWIIGSVMILISEDYAAGLFDINRGVVRWVARYAPYHASLIQEYPPFAFDTGAEGAAAAPPPTPTA